MVAVTAGAVFVWLLTMIAIDPASGFDFKAELAPPFLYKFSINLELAPPLLLWAMLALSGVVHWNRSEEELGITGEGNERSEVLPEEQSDRLNDLRELVNRNQG